MKRLINVRLSLVCVLGLIGGILCFYEVLFGDFIPLALCGGLVVVALVVCICRKSRFWVHCLAFLVTFAVGCSHFALIYHRQQQREIFPTQCQVVGRVTDIGRNGGESNVVYLEDCTVDGQKIGGRIKVNSYDGSLFDTGNVVTLQGTISSVYPVQPNIKTFYVRDNVRYQLTGIALSDIQTGKLTASETVRKYVYQTALQYMPHNADVAYALLTGDRNAMEEDSVSAFQAAGIIHLLVVSGLHVGFVVTVFGLFLRKLNPMLQFAILAVPLLFYAYICDFSPSVVRAVVMTACVFLTKFLHGRYDLISSLCWAAVFILIVRPLYLFDVGFQLSVLSVFGVATVYLQIDRRLRKIKLHKALRWLISTMAMSFSCIVATFCACAYYFGKVAVWGIFINIVAIPLVFAAFVICLVGLFPFFFHYVFYAADYLLEGVVWLAKLAESVQGSIPVYVFALGIVLTVVILFAVGGYINLGKISKRIFYPVCAVLIAVSFILPFFPKQNVNQIQVFFGYQDTMLLVTSEQDEVAIIGDFCDSYVASDLMQKLTRQKATVTLYFTDVANSDLAIVSDICDVVDVGKVYFLNHGGNSQLEEYLDERQIAFVQAYPNDTVGNSISVQPVYDGGLIAVVVGLKSIKVATVLYPSAKAQHFADVRQDIDCFVVCDDMQSFVTQAINITMVQQKYQSNFGANKYGNFTISEKDGTMILNFRRTQF